MLSGVKTAFISGFSRLRIRAIGKTVKLMDIFSSASATSPVMDRAVLLTARQLPLSWAKRVRQQSSKDAVSVFCKAFCMVGLLSRDQGSILAGVWRFVVRGRRQISRCALWAALRALHPNEQRPLAGDPVFRQSGGSCRAAGNWCA